VTEQELLRELSLLRQRIKELEQSESRHRQAEEELKRSEEQYRTLVEKMQDAVYRADLNGNLIFTTPSAARILGYSSVEEMIGLNIANHFYHDPAEARKHGEMLREQGVLTQYEVTLKRRDTGKPVTVSANTQFYRDKEGNIIGIEGVYSDITARKRAEEQLLESEEKFSRMFRMSPDIMTISRLSDGKYIDVNDEFTRQVGYGREETIGRTSLDLGIWVDYSDRDRVIGLLQEKGEINDDEFRFCVKDGRVVIGEMSAKVITLGGEQCLLSIFREITAKVEARKALAESEERFRSVVEKSLVGIAIIDDSFRYTYVNEEFCRLAGYSEKEMLGRDFTFPLMEESASITAERAMRRQRGEEVPSRYEFSFRQKKGPERIGELRSAVYHDSSGKVKTLIQVIDTTESKQAEEALRKSEAYFRAITENASDILVISDMDGIITYASPSIERIAGYSPEELTGVNFFELIVPEDVPRVMEDFARALQTQNTYIPNSFRVRHKDGSELVLEGVGANLIHDPALTGFVMSARDITERKRMEDALREKERLLDLITENMSDMIRITDLQGRNLYVSPSHFKGLGYRMEERVGKPVFDIVHPDDLERMINVFADGLTSKRAVITEYRVRHADGHYGWLETVADLLKDDQGEMTAIIMSSRDVSERKKAEERLQRAEKMEALGILAGGVAHDLNNVLGVLVGYSELLLRDLPEGSRAEKHAKNILHGGERAAAIIQDLLTMARRGVSVAETVNLNRIVTDCFKTPEFELMKAHHPDVRFLCQTEKDLFNIKGSPVHLSKSIMNLLSNAAEAIQGEGTVTITTENRYVDAAIPGYEDTQEGEYVVLTVTDTGSGIAPEDMGRLFEPFYTKKVMGRSGTGLGLAVVWGTVKDHNGYIDVRTELNKGTSFVLYFPVTREALLKTDQALAESEYRGKGESILIVDDVEEQRLLAATILEGLNYRVALAASGEEALEYLQGNKADLIVLDMIMDPGIDGLETYHRILEIRPQQKAIIVSGFARTERVSKAQELGAGEYVKKPYNIERLGMAVRGELDRGKMES